MYPPSSSTSDGGGGGVPCLQNFLVGMYCDISSPDAECLVFAAIEPGTPACFGTQFVQLCGSMDEISDM
jgi:hypothetical protein